MGGVGGIGGSGPPSSGSETHRGGCCHGGEGRDPHPCRLSPLPRLLPLRRRTEQNGGGVPLLPGERGHVLPGSGTLSPRGLWGRSRMGFPTPTPEQMSFSLCTRADLPLLSTLFIQTEAAGWFSHLCVCRYIDFVLKEDRLTPAGSGVFVMPPAVLSCPIPSHPWGGRVPAGLMCPHPVA